MSAAEPPEGLFPGDDGARFKLSPFWVQITLDDGTVHEMIALAYSSADAPYVLTNRLRAERGLPPYADGLGVTATQVRRLPGHYADWVPMRSSTVRPWEGPLRRGRAAWRKHPMLLAAEICRSMAFACGLILGSSTLWEWLWPHPQSTAPPVQRIFAAALVTLALVALACEWVDGPVSRALLGKQLAAERAARDAAAARLAAEKPVPGDD